MKIKIITDTTGPVEASLTEENPKTAKAIWDALPIEAYANTWGDEIYFSIPVDAAQENAKEIVDMGDLAYWPPGNAFCIFFGRTPASRGDEIRPASAVNVFGKIDGDAKIFKKVRGGEKIRLERG
ncbi:MAG: cyclophilin-like fold protein [Candidatus Bathyarchaeota archaeon]|nr:cyclophilin-like fold protein [Candidatus Bathyarchaeota archaeon]